MQYVFMLLYSAVIIFFQSTCLISSDQPLDKTIAAVLDPPSVYREVFHRSPILLCAENLWFFF